MSRKLNCILLVDDDEGTNVLNRMVIEELQCAEYIKTAYNGLEALDFLRSTTDGKHPQPELILLDINMPEMDGWEFLDEYYKLNTDQLGHVVVVMLTTSLNPEDEEKANAIPNIAGFLTKPLTEPVLKDIIEHYFPKEIFEEQ